MKISIELLIRSNCSPLTPGNFDEIVTLLLDNEINHKLAEELITEAIKNPALSVHKVSYFNRFFLNFSEILLIFKCLFLSK